MGADEIDRLSAGSREMRRRRNQRERPGLARHETDGAELSIDVVIQLAVLLDDAADTTLVAAVEHVAVRAEEDVAAGVAQVLLKRLLRAAAGRFLANRILIRE